MSSPKHHFLQYRNNSLLEDALASELKGSTDFSAWSKGATEWARREMVEGKVWEEAEYFVPLNTPLQTGGLPGGEQSYPHI